MLAMPASNKSLAQSGNVIEFLAFRSGVPDGVVRHYGPHLRYFIAMHTGSCDFAKEQVDLIFQTASACSETMPDFRALQNFLNNLTVEVVLAYLRENILKRVRLLQAASPTFGEFEGKFQELIGAGIEKLTPKHKMVYKALFNEGKAESYLSVVMRIPVEVISLYKEEAVNALIVFSNFSCFPVLVAFFLRAKPVSTPIEFEKYRCKD
jgi:hypothetical protein